jgi:hypothetical protein
MALIAAKFKSETTFDLGFIGQFKSCPCVIN